MRFIKLNYANGGLDNSTFIVLNIKKIGYLEPKTIEGKECTYVKYDGSGGFDVKETEEEIKKLITTATRL